MEPHKSTRKACDLCYTRKMKCDAQKPRCSHCVVYGSECTYKAASRKATPRRKGSSKGEEALQSRVQRLETCLTQVQEKVERLESLAPPIRIAPECSSLVEGEDIRQVEESLHHAFMDLPPKYEVLRAVEKYLTTFNSFLPLFHPGTLLHIVESWYSYPHARDSTAWAAINVVLALAHRQSNPDETIPSKSIAEYLNNAQSVLTEVMMGPTDLINVQVIVGLVTLLQGAEDLGPPTMLIATALRLAHKLGLHSRRSSEHLDHSVALQRSRVFWIIYILDRDISMRNRQPPLQLDSDIELDLPPDKPDSDGAGFVFSTDGQSKMNFLRARVQLARIEGSVYHCVYSVRAQNSNPDERSENVARIRHMLDDWTSQIPQGFSPTIISQAGPPGFSRNFCILYGTRLSCRSLVSQTHLMDSQLVGSLQEYGKRAATGETTVRVTLPQDWQTLVNEAREYMGLFMSIERKDAAFIWMTTCSYVAGLICLAANNMCNPQHGELEFDMQLADTALVFLEDMVQQTRGEKLRRIRDSCKELLNHALIVIQQSSHGSALQTSQFLNREALPSPFVGYGGEDVVARYGDEQVFENSAPVTAIGPYWEVSGASIEADAPRWPDSMRFSPSCLQRNRS